MDTPEAIRQRRSIRAYKPEIPSKKLILDILLDAHKAPSSSNIQPWEFVVVSGSRLVALREHLLMLNRQTSAGYPSSGSRDNPVPDHIWQRQRTLGRSMKKIAESMGLDHLSFIVEGSLTFWGAPLAVLILLDQALSTNHLVDIGLAVENMMLSAYSRGLGTCPIGMSNAYSDEIIRFLEIEERKKLVLAVAVGYPDEKAPINLFKSQRAPESEIITWLE